MAELHYGQRCSELEYHILSLEAQITGADASNARQKSAGHPIHWEALVKAVRAEQLRLPRVRLSAVLARGKHSGCTTPDSCCAMATETDLRSRPSRPPMLAMKPSSTGSLYGALHSSGARLRMLCSTLVCSAGPMALSLQEQHVLRLVALDAAGDYRSSTPKAAGHHRSQAAH